jgi:hypothetical protein
MGDVDAPDLVWPDDRQVSERIWIFFVRGMLFAGLGLLVDRDQPHQLHQSPHVVPKARFQRDVARIFGLLVACGGPFTDRQGICIGNIPRGCRDPYHGVSRNCLSPLGIMLRMALPGSACLHSREGPKNRAPRRAGRSWRAVFQPSSQKQAAQRASCHQTPKPCSRLPLSSTR